jgi:tetratricopeptide (TPR) repeat protein
MVPHRPTRRALPATLALAVAVAFGMAATAPRVARAEDPPAAAQAIVAGDAFQRDYDFEGALRSYRAGLERDSTSYALWWRLARAYDDRGQRAEFAGDKDRAEISYDEAVRAARRATVLEPDGWEGHLELAAALGRLALFKGGKEKVRLAREVKVEADRALGLNPRSDRAYHVLARWNRGIAQLNFFEKAAARVVFGGVPKGASMNNAVTLFEKAIELAPDYANHRLELGRTYLDLGLKDKAREQLEKALACPIRSPFDAEYKTEAQKLLARAKD